jgi:predicted TIM-barrel fold metal-dependent hydrolase
MINQGNNTFKILDFHTHFAGDPTKFDHVLAGKFEGLQPRQSFNQRQVGRDPNALIEYLDGAGVDIVCVLAEEGPPTNYSVETSFILGYAGQAPDRILGIGNINPRIEVNVERRVQNLIDAGIKGFKLYCADHNQNPYDKKLVPLFEICQEYALPILIHTGTTSHYSMAHVQLGNPSYFIQLFTKYDRIPFLLCHGGKGGHHKDCVQILHDYPNTFIEISDIAPVVLKAICTEDLCDRFIFGTDMPQFPDYMPLIQNVLDLELTASARRKILFDNGARILDLKMTNTDTLKVRNIGANDN